MSDTRYTVKDTRDRWIGTVIVGDDGLVTIYGRGSGTYGHFLADEKSLQIRFGGGAKNKANSCIITLDDDDTYTVRFAKVGRAPRFDVTECGTTSMVYADSLRKHFESATGFYLSL